MRDLNRLQCLRLFKPRETIAATRRGVDSPELDAQLWVMLQMSPAEPSCFLCEEAAGIPSVMGYVDIPGKKMVVAVCPKCADVPELVRAICYKLGFRPLEYSGMC
jgi:hypothetical protein